MQCWNVQDTYYSAFLSFFSSDSLRVDKSFSLYSDGGDVGRYRSEWESRDQSDCRYPLWRNLEVPLPWEQHKGIIQKQINLKGLIAQSKPKSHMDKYGESEWPKTFLEALMKGQRKQYFCVFVQELT